MVMKHQFDAFIDDLKATHGRNLASVVLYGSAATVDFVKNQSDYNLLIALNKITPEDLRAAQAPMREWSRLGHSVPVYFTVSELQNAADVFPIEFYQMEQAHIILYGENVLAGLNISDEHLRHQTEYELRSKLIKLRRAFIPASTSGKTLTALMANSLPDFITVFRAVLLLHKAASPNAKQEVIAAIAEHLKIDGEPFEKILNFKESKSAKTLDDKSVNQLFADYMREIENVIEAVDKV